MSVRHNVYTRLKFLKAVSHSMGVHRCDPYTEATDSDSDSPDDDQASADAGAATVNATDANETDNCEACLVKAKFHYTGPTGPRPDPRGPARTLSETRTDQRSFSEIRVVRVRAGPVGSGRARVVEFSQYQTKSADFVWSGPVRSGPCSRVVQFSYNAARTSPRAGTMRPSAILRRVYSSPGTYWKWLSYLPWGHQHGSTSVLIFCVNFYQLA